jgi:hypothetical protein
MFATELLSQLTNFGAGPYNAKRENFRGFQIGGAAAQVTSVKPMLFSSKEGHLQGKHLEVLEFLNAIEKCMKSLHSMAENLIAKKIWAIANGVDSSEYGQSHPTPSQFLNSLMTPGGHCHNRMGIQAWFSSKSWIASRANHCDAESRCRTANN